MKFIKYLVGPGTVGDTWPDITVRRSRFNGRQMERIAIQVCACTITATGRFRPQPAEALDQ